MIRGSSAAHAQRETAGYIAGPEGDGGRNADYFPLVKGSQPGVQRAAFDLTQETGRKAPDHVELGYGHGRVIRRSPWITGAGDLDFPRVTTPWTCCRQPSPSGH